MKIIQESNPLSDVIEGEMQSKSLGWAVYAFDDNGNSVLGQVGELVCTNLYPKCPSISGNTNKIKN